MNRQNATDYDGNQGHSLTKHEALKAEIHDQRQETEGMLRKIRNDIERLQEQQYELHQELGQIPGYDVTEELSYQELAALTEDSGLVVPDELLAEDEHDDGTGEALAAHQAADPHCSCSACIDAHAARLTETAGQEIIGAQTPTGFANVLDVLKCGACQGFGSYRDLIAVQTRTCEVCGGTGQSHLQRLQRAAGITEAR